MRERRQDIRLKFTAMPVVLLSYAPLKKDLCNLNCSSIDPCKLIKVLLDIGRTYIVTVVIKDK